MSDSPTPQTFRAYMESKEMTPRTSFLRSALALALILALAGAISLLAAGSASAQTGSDNYKTIQALGGANRFDLPLKDAKAVQTWVAKKRAQDGIKTVFDKAGLSSVTATVLDKLAKGEFEETDFQPGGTMTWMAFRHGGAKPDIVRNLKWGAKKPFKAYTFIIDDLNQTYTFILPKTCANIALVTSEPSREKARLDAEKAAKDKAEADRLAAEKARLDAERRAREKAAADKAAADKAAADKAAADKAAADAKAAADKAAADKAAADKKAWDAAEKTKFIVSPLFGKERRTRTTDNVDTSLCSALFGLKAGAEIKVNDSMKIAPVGGVAFNFEDSGHTAIFAEVEFNGYTKDQKTYFGAGFGVWDFAHSDWISPTLSLQFGREMWNNQQHSHLYFVGEGRMFLNKMSDMANNYQFWAGLRWALK